MILYIHGFGTTGKDSQKAKELADYFGDEKVLRPSWPYRPKDAFNMLSEIMQNNNIRTVVASSFGGFFAILLAQNFDANYVFINPSLNPDLTLQRALNQILVLPNDEKVFIDNYFIDEIANLKNSADYTKINQKRLYFYLSENDEVLDHSMIPTLFPNAAKIKFFKNSRHNFGRFKEILPEIESINNKL